MGSTNPTNPLAAMSAGTMFNLRVPMPIPRTQNALFFNGRYIDDFLSRIVQHGAMAGITNADELVTYIVDYSSDMVKDLIINMDEFDPDSMTKTWNAAKEALKTLYSSSDLPKEYTEEELKEFCHDRSIKYSFSKLSDVDDYLRAYVGIAASLKKRKVITDKEYDLYFIHGLPHSIKEWFMSAVPSANRTVSAPPSVNDSLKILRGKFDKNLIIYEEWNSPEDKQAKSGFDSNGN